VYLLSGRYCFITEPKEQRPGNSQAKGPLKLIFWKTSGSSTDGASVS